jgi:hypothetical protein
MIAVLVNLSSYAVKQELVRIKKSHGYCSYVIEDLNKSIMIWEDLECFMRGEFRAKHNIVLTTIDQLYDIGGEYDSNVEFVRETNQFNLKPLDLQEWLQMKPRKHCLVLQRVDPLEMVIKNVQEEGLLILYLTLTNANKDIRDRLRFHLLSWMFGDCSEASLIDYCNKHIISGKGKSLLVELMDKYKKDGYKTLLKELKRYKKKHDEKAVLDLCDKWKISSYEGNYLLAAYRSINKVAK